MSTVRAVGCILPNSLDQCGQHNRSWKENPLLMDWAWAEWDRTSCEGDHRSIGPSSLARMQERQTLSGDGRQQEFRSEDEKSTNPRIWRSKFYSAHRVPSGVPGTWKILENISHVADSGIAHGEQDSAPIAPLNTTFLLSSAPLHLSPKWKVQEIWAVSRCRLSQAVEGRSMSCLKGELLRVHAAHAFWNLIVTVSFMKMESLAGDYFCCPSSYQTC